MIGLLSVLAWGQVQNVVNPPADEGDLIRYGWESGLRRGALCPGCGCSGVWLTRPHRIRAVRETGRRRDASHTLCGALLPCRGSEGRQRFRAPALQSFRCGRRAYSLSSGATGVMAPRLRCHWSVRRRRRGAFEGYLRSRTAGGMSWWRGASMVPRTSELLETPRRPRRCAIDPGGPRQHSVGEHRQDR